MDRIGRVSAAAIAVGRMALGFLAITVVAAAIIRFLRW